MKKLILTTSILLLAAACGKPVSPSASRGGQAQVQPVQNQQPSAQEQTKPADETASWKTYTNTEHGFSVQFPESYVAKKLSNGNVSIFLSEYANTGTEAPAINITTNSKSASELVTSTLKDEGQNLVSNKQIDFAGAKAQEITVVSELGGGHSSYIIFSHSNITYEILFDDNQNFEPILNTFKFSK